MVSLYLRHSEGMSPENARILEAVAARLALHNGPWVLAGDFNMTPQQLALSGWPDIVQGRVVQPVGPTCNDRVIDFFVVSHHLASSVVGAQRIIDAGVRPHFPVRLLLRPTVSLGNVRHLKRPHRIPGSPDTPSSGSCRRGKPTLLGD